MFNLIEICEVIYTVMLYFIDPYGIPQASLRSKHILFG